MNVINLSKSLVDWIDYYSFKNLFQDLYPDIKLVSEKINSSKIAHKCKCIFIPEEDKSLYLFASGFKCYDCGNEGNHLELYKNYLEKVDKSILLSLAQIRIFSLEWITTKKN
ncbi:MAG: hypothetical protein OQK82_00615 [Candidatus Pacearchaeota archaeon]|nr:hypothetical protein [Candidatus Pacearchaeota archaeon]